MRELKFRAYDIKTKTMFPNVGYHPYQAEFHKGSPSQEEGTMTLCPALADFHLMQYTGLKDKKGKEIYEGDILHHPYKGVKEVFWDDTEGGFFCEGTYLNRMTDGGEIIGNIYENPELLH